MSDPVSRELADAWRKNRPGKGQIPADFQHFVPLRVETALEGREVQHVSEVEFAGQAAALVIADKKLHVLRVTEDLQVEVVFLGTLLGGEYQERIGDGFHLEYAHPRLDKLKISSPLVFKAASAGDLATLRALFREWAETTD
jgi:hypothetical protein